MPLSHTEVVVRPHDAQPITISVHRVIVVSVFDFIVEYILCVFVEHNLWLLFFMALVLPQSAVGCRLLAAQCVYTRCRPAGVAQSFPATR